MRNFPGKICKEDQTKFYVVCVCIYTYIYENRAVYEIMWKNMVESDSPKMII